MKIIVKERFSIHEETSKKFKIYEVSNKIVDIDEINGQKAIAQGYAKKAEEIKTANNNN